MPVNHDKNAPKGNSDKPRRVSKLIVVLCCVALISVVVAIFMPSMGVCPYNWIQHNCQENLKRIGDAVVIYLGEHSYEFPASLSDLKPYLEDADVLKCPAVRHNTTEVSYMYIGHLLGKYETQPHIRRIIAFDDRPRSHAEDGDVDRLNGRNVLFSDGTVHYRDEKEFILELVSQPTGADKEKVQTH